MKKLISLLLILAFVLPAGIASAGQMSASKALFKLGKKLYTDKNLSINRNQSCKSCHHNNSGFADPRNARKPWKNVVSVGSIRTETGGLNAPTAAYAFGSPKMFWDGELFIGGIFWNGRAHGHKPFKVGCLVPGYDQDIIYSPLAEQAQGPFTNPVEMALPNNAEVVKRVKNSNYAHLFKKAFKKVMFKDVDLTFDQIAIAIAFFEESRVLNRFSSDYDLGLMSEKQKDGFDLFNNKAMCALCHVTDGGQEAAFFTDFSYDNLGLPVNPLIEDKGIDPGLGGFLDLVVSNPDAYPYDLVMHVSNGGWLSAVTENWGKHKVSTLRNIELTPPYGHNGFFPNLTSIVQFYNTRDTLDCKTGGEEIPVTPALLARGKIPGYNGVTGYCWPAPEIVENVNDVELGALGLTNDEVDSIVAFLEALTD